MSGMVDANEVMSPADAFGAALQLIAGSATHARSAGHDDNLVRSVTTWVYVSSSD